ncbi:Rho termination factor N-terminal domain-containing protein [Vibrio sp.]|uniref:Rho termination factor N-terminal domain-containing protein n=1 Tax=Vibrio sp. TaxID=678 RepID=UPI003D149722
MTLTKKQEDDLARLKKIAKDVPDNIVKNPREALKLAFRLGVINHWRDDGNSYLIGFPKLKPVRKRTHQVADFIVDKILSVKDPLNETVEGKPEEEPIQEKTEDNSEQESEKDSTEEGTERPLNYDDLTVAELKDLCRERDLSGYSTLRKDELIMMLELDDTGVLHK